MDCINFQKNIRPYNNGLAFASFGANFENFSRNGPQVIRICGQIYQPPDKAARRYYKCHPKKQVPTVICLLCENAYH